MLLDTTHDGARLSLYGVTASGASVRLEVPDFRPYFFVRVPARDADDGDDGEALAAFTAALERALGPATSRLGPKARPATRRLQAPRACGAHTRWVHPQPHVERTERVRRQSLLHYSTGPSDFFRVVLARPRGGRAAVQALGTRFSCIWHIPPVAWERENGRAE
jgi:hypothetical protein